MVARGLMYSAVYFHRVTRVTEIMLSRAVERSEGSLPEAVDMQRMVDAEIWRALDEAGGIARDMIRRLKYRQMLKPCVERRLEELSEQEVDRLIEIASDADLRRRVEDAIAQRSGVQEGYVAIDVPSVKLLLSEPRMAAIEIRILGRDGKARWFREHTPVAEALRRRRVSQTAMSVMTLPGHESHVASIAERIIHGDVV